MTERDRTQHAPLVLVTNDDGIASPGLVALAHELEERGISVLVAAPATDMSGSAAAIGPVDPRVPAREVAIDGVEGAAYEVDAPPAMIVVAAHNGAFGAVPTAVASGVNAGVNIGRAILHSGTVGAALTGQNLGLPSIAVSVQTGGRFDVAAKVGVDVFQQLLWQDSARLANVNVPKNANGDSEPVPTKLAHFGAVTAAMVGNELNFQLTIDPAALDQPGTDGAAIRAGQVSVTWLKGFAGAQESEADVSLRAVAPGGPAGAAAE